jgi:hypothetical protein
LYHAPWEHWWRTVQLFIRETSDMELSKVPRDNFSYQGAGKVRH